MKKETVTIEDLAQMVQKGFDHVDNQFKRVDEQFRHVDEQFAEVRHELKAIRRDMLDVVYQPEFDDLKDRVVELENTTLRKKAA